jgi:hypothetical protein
LRLKKLLNKDGELKLNSEAVKQINFNSVTIPKLPLRMSDEQPWLRPDESLPGIPPPSGQHHSSTTTTTDTVAPRRSLYIALPPDSLKKLKKGMSMSFKLPPPDGISLGNGKRMVGVSEPGAGGFSISGLDFTKPFSKDFWQFKRKRNRTRTREVLKNY